MMLPQIVSSYDPGRNQSRLQETVASLESRSVNKDLSCIWMTPALGTVPTRAVASWLSLYFPANQKIARMFALGMEVGEAYSSTIASIIEHPDLSQYKYILSVEHDNVPPPDGAVQLLRRMEEHPEFAAIGGLYFTKGEGGFAQIWGNPNEPLSFRPQLPVENELIECCAVAMGFTVFRVDLFKDTRLRRPWFKMGEKASDVFSTQDFYAWSDFRKYGYRCAVDCSVAVGHYDLGTDIVW